jgi:erythromycin esterase
MKPLFALILSLTIWAFACKEDEDPVDPVTASLLKTLNEELSPLSPDPMLWTNDELQFLDAVSDHTIVGLGEATHGSAEFFKAKHRILKYLVENHGFKIFAIEADFGESMLINQAVLNSDKSQIESLMKEKMHFWTWRTNEVRDLLYWMCDYNVGKTATEKVQYWGVDCQYNTYHPDMVKKDLEDANVSFIAFAEGILNEASSASSSRFSNYTQQAFDAYLEKVNALKDSLTKYEADIIDKGSTKQYQLTLQLVEEIREVSEVMYYAGKQGVVKNYRDEYMAKNTGWLHKYFDDAKIVLWAHNFHVSDYTSAGSMGHRLKADFPGNYETIGFLFSKGSFTAVTQVGDKFQGINTQLLEDDPKLGSLNDVMFRAKAEVFRVALSDLQSHDEWRQAFLRKIEYFQMGALYNNNPSDYYATFNASFFDYLIYFHRTTASVQVT